MVMELEPPPKFVITFRAEDKDTARFGAPFFFALPSCEENPTCKNGDLEFTMEFDPGIYLLMNNTFLKCPCDIKHNPPCAQKG
jgi:hypothetical protein